tara:strand:- start:2946 stop:3434 length:489 start_codon:yes stop_codon:yes gene_type:complete
MKYTDDMIRAAVEKSKSVIQTVRALGYTGNSSSVQTHIGQRIKRLGLDTSHFTGQGWAKGQKARNRLTAEQVLVLDEDKEPPRASMLRRALLETGRRERCEWCELEKEWQGKSLRLQIDHINGNRKDNRAKNLRFLCPNCHSQTDTHSRRKATVVEMEDTHR